jgi:ParB family transcriptional regulator, chromosome partitioning protein
MGDVSLDEASASQSSRLIPVVNLLDQLATLGAIEEPMRFPPINPKEVDMGGKSRKRDRKTKDKSHFKDKKEIKNIPQTQEDVLVEDVQIVGKRRELDQKKVKALAASISMVGLRTPITVRRIEKERDGVSTTVLALVAGGYRLEAFKTLGLKRIPAFVIEGDKADARILQLIENLYRADLSALHHAEDLAELIGIVQTEGGQVAHRGGKQPHDRGVSRAAKVLGFSRREVRRSLEIANITDEAKAKAVEVGFDKIQSRLLTIANEEGAEAQLAKIDEMTNAEASGSKTSSSSKTKAKKKASKASEDDTGSPPTVPEPGDQSDSDWDDSEDEEQSGDQSDSDWEDEEQPGDQSDSEPQDSDDLADSDDSDDEERLFSALKAAWDTAPQSVRKRFVKNVLHLDLDQIDGEIWAAD